MKKLIKIMVALLCVVSLTSLSSCSKDDTSNDVSGNGEGRSLLFGKWKITKCESYNSYSESWQPVNSRIGEIWEFKYWDEDGGLLYIGENWYGFTIDGNKLKIVSMKDCTITTLTNNELILDFKYDDGTPAFHIEFARAE